MSFQFTFNNSPSSSREASPAPADEPQDVSTTLEPLPPHALPQSLQISSLISSLPDSLAYSRIPAPLSLPRRPLFDTKLQAFSGATLPDTSSAVHIGLSSPSDLHRGTYEGGFKTWEGSHDLAAYILSSHNEVESGDGIIAVELGAGAALPSCVLLREALKSGMKARIVVQDYNREVLELVTLPNLVLAWLDFAGLLPDENEGDIELAPRVLESFVKGLSEKQIEIVLVSGGWGKEMAILMEELGVAGGLVLAAETIYQSDSLPYFLEVLERTIGDKGNALVAAKEFYFGVGGNVGEFMDAVRKRGGKAETKWKGGEGGVGRVVIEVRK